MIRAFHYTTRHAAPGSISSLLRDDAARDPVEALKQLRAVAATPPSQALDAPVQVFNALMALQQKKLVQAIVVLDQSPTMPDLEGAINKALGYIASSEQPTRCTCTCSGGDTAGWPTSSGRRSTRPSPRLT